MVSLDGCPDEERSPGDLLGGRGEAVLGILPHCLLAAHGALGRPGQLDPAHQEDDERRGPQEPSEPAWQARRASHQVDHGAECHHADEPHPVVMVVDIAGHPRALTRAMAVAAHRGGVGGAQPGGDTVVRLLDRNPTSAVTDRTGAHFCTPFRRVFTMSTKAGGRAAGSFAILTSTMRAARSPASSSEAARASAALRAFSQAWAASGCTFQPCLAATTSTWGWARQTFSLLVKPAGW